MRPVDLDPPSAAACPFSSAKGQPPQARSVPTPRAIPIEKGLPLIGLIPHMLLNGPGLLKRLASRFAEPIFGIHLGPMPAYVISHPDHVREVLVERAREFTKGPMWRGMSTFAGTGSFMLEGEPWLQRRRLLQPLFAVKSLARIAPTMIAAIQRDLDRIEQVAATRGTVDLRAEMAELAQHILLESILGTSLLPGEVHTLSQEMTAVINEITLRILLHFLPDSIPLPGARRYKRAIATLDKAIERIVSDRLGKPERHDDLLSLLLSVRDDSTPEVMNNRQIRDELAGFFLAGAETAANTLAWLWYVLHCHPDVDRRLRAEVAEVLGGRTPTMDDLPRLEYTKRVFQESMRIYPATWILPRYSEAETTIGGYRIPARSVLLISPYLTHRSPGIWDQPERFDPDRFLPERIEARPRLAYCPFGGGPHLCIGNTFAMMESQLIAVMMVQRFRIHLVPGQSMVPGPKATLQPRYGVKAQLERLG